MTDDLDAAARQLIAARSEQDLHHAAVSALARLTGADRCELVLDDGGTLVSQASVTFGHAGPALESPLDAHRAILEHAYEIGESGLIDDLTAVRSASDGGASSASARYRSLLCVPIEGRGLFVAADRDPSFFSGAERESITRLADYVAAGLDRLAGGGADRTSRREAVANVISHDVQNAITVASGRLELARDEVESEHLEGVERAHERLLDMTDDLVTVLRTGDSVTSIEAFDLATEAERAWNAVDVADANLEVGRSGAIMADASSLCQLFENLFRNAVDHAGPDARVVVGVTPEHDGFFVEDDGPGIPPDERDAVFEMGYTTGDRSTGYGLAIVRRIVQAHAWDVEATEGRDGGARFEVTGVDVL